MLPLLLACSQPDPESKPAPEDSGTLTGPSCPSELWWGFPPSDDAVWVDPAHGDDAAGDGSEGAPWATLGTALGAGTAEVAVLPGTLAEAIVVDRSLRIRGQCRESVILEPGYTADVAAMAVDAEGAEVLASGLTIRGAWRNLDAAAGLVQLDGVDLVGGRRSGVHGGREGSEVRLVFNDVRVSDGEPDEALPAYGLGVSVELGATLKWTRGEAARNTVQSVSAFGPPSGGFEWSLDLQDVDILDNQACSFFPDGGAALLVSDGATGRFADGLIERSYLYAAVAQVGGVLELERVAVTEVSAHATRTATGGAALMALQGGELSCVDCVVSGGTCAAVEVDRGAMHLSGATTVGETTSCQDGSSGWGVHVQSGTLDADGVSVVGNRGAGLVATGDSEVTLVGVEVSGTVDDDPTSGDGGYGQGLSAEVGALIDCSGCTLDRNTTYNARAVEGGTLILRDGTTISDGKPDADGHNGLGVAVYDGSALVIDHVTITGGRTYGVYVTGKGAVATIDGLTVDGLANGADGIASGLHVSYEAQVEATGVLVRNVEGIGADALMEGRLSLDQVVIEDVRSPEVVVGAAGLSSTYGGSLDVTGGAISGVEMMGVSVGFESEARLEDVHVTDMVPYDDVSSQAPWADDVGSGLVVSGGSVVEVAGSEFADGTQVGAYVSGVGTTATFDETWVTDTRAASSDRTAWGFIVDDNAVVSWEGGGVSGTEGVGVAVASNGLLDVTGATVSDTARTGKRLVGLGVDVNGGVVLGAGLSVTGTFGPGVAVRGGGSLDCAGCSVEGNGFSGLELVDADATLSEGSRVCDNGVDESVGGGVGVLAVSDAATATLLLEDSEVCAHPLAAVLLSGDGAYTLDRDTLAGGAAADSTGPWGNAVAALAGEGDHAGLAGTSSALDGRGLAITDSLLSGAEDVAVYLGGSSATLCGNTFTDNAVDIQQDRASSTEPPDGCDVDGDLDEPEFDRAYSLPYPVWSDDPLPSLSGG